MKQGSNQKVLPNSGQPTKELRHGPNGLKRRALSPPKSPFRRIAQGTQTERFEGGIDRHDFFCPNPRPKPGPNAFRQDSQAIPKVDDPSDSLRIFNGALLCRLDKFREQIAGKHGLYEPNWLPLGHFSEAQSKRETLNPKLRLQGGRGQMLALWLRP
jgi:hypothetical protein